MNSEIHIIKYDNKEIQRVQRVALDSWDELDFYDPVPAKESFERICNLYENHIIPKAPYAFGTLVFFSLPKDMELPFTYPDTYGEISDPLIAAAIKLRECIRMNSFSIHDSLIEEFIEKLKAEGLFRIIKGKRPNVKIMPISPDFGFLSAEKESTFKVNASFFVMDMFDIGSVYDCIGIPIGLRISKGKMMSLPQFGREALLAKKDGSIKICTPSVCDFDIVINGQVFSKDNCIIYERTERKYTPKSCRTDIVIIENKIAAVHRGGKTPVPSSGCVLSTPEATNVRPGDTVSFIGAGDICFGIQTGNSAVIDGEKVNEFRSYFSNVKNIFTHNIPPSLYPRNYEKDRAPRIIIGAGEDNKPVILWLEGPGKNGYTPGTDSCGASLSEAAEISKSLGLINAVNLDGGGSAQILYNGKRELMISDRNHDGSEAERPIPIGIVLQRRIE